MKRYLPLIFLLIFVLLFIFYSPLKGVFLFISRPFLNLTERSVLSITRFSQTIQTVKSLTASNEQLNQEIQRLRSEKMVLLEREKENEALKRQLGFISENKQKEFIAAQVIGRSPSAFVQYLILDKGSQDGILTGQTVVSEGFLVGRVKEAYPTTSLVFLITNPSSAIAALTSENRSSGLVKGEVGYGLLLVDVPKEAPLKEGENVLTSGLGGDFGKGIPIGAIEKIYGSPSELFQRASLKPPLDFFKLEYVLVIKR